MDGETARRVIERLEDKAERMLWRGFYLGFLSGAVFIYFIACGITQRILPF